MQDAHHEKAGAGHRVLRYRVALNREILHGAHSIGRGYVDLILAKVKLIVRVGDVSQVPALGMVKEVRGR